MAIVLEGAREKLYLSPTADQVEILENLSPVNAPPQDMNPNSPNLVSGRGYGISKWQEIFTERQLVALEIFTQLSREVSEKARIAAINCGLEEGCGLREGGTGAKAYGESISIYTSFLISKLADKGSTLCTWDSGPKSNKTSSGRSARAATVRVTFGRQALPMSWDFAEVNFFSDSAGSINTVLNTICASLESMPETSLSGTAIQHDAQTQALSTKKVVSTDPPYYDNIAYADLSDFLHMASPGLERNIPRHFCDPFDTQSRGNRSAQRETRK